MRMISPFEKTDNLKKNEAVLSLQGTWDKFSKLTGFVPLPIFNSPPLSQNSTQNPTATKRKTNMTDDESFIHLTKSSKNPTSNNKSTPKLDTNNKFETPSNLSEDCKDIDNVSNAIPTEPKPQPIFMKLTDNFSEIISSLENSLNSLLKKKINGDLIQICPADIIQ